MSRARSGRAARVARLSTEWLRLSAVCTIVVASSAVGFRCITEVLCPMPFGLWPSGGAFAVEKGGEKCTVFRQKPRAFCRKWKPFAEKAGASCREARFGRARRCFVERGGALHRAGRGLSLRGARTTVGRADGLFVEHHGHEEHEHVLVVLLFGGDDDAGARGIGELHHDFVAFEVVE